MGNPSPSWVKLLGLLATPCCQSSLLPVLRQSRKLLASGGLRCSCFFGAYPDMLEMVNLPHSPDPCTVNTQKTIDIGLKRKSSLQLRCLLRHICVTPGSSNPVPAAGDHRGNEPYYGGGGSCASQISNLNLSTSTLISNINSSQLGGH